MSAGIAQLEECLKPGFYEELEKKTAGFVNQVQSHVDAKGYPFHMFHVGSIFWMSFSNKNRVQRAEDIDPNSGERFKVFFDRLLEGGVYVGPSSYEVGFVSDSHTDEDLDRAGKTMIAALDQAYA